MRIPKKRSPKAKGLSSKVILIIDGEATVRRAYARALKPDFDEVLTASDPAEALSVLEKRPVTHLVCGRSFGPDMPQGMDLIPKWRKTYPSINRALILTRADIAQMPAPPEIDGILAKPITPERLVKALCLAG